MGHFLYSKEGVNQGDKLAIVAYVLGIVSLLQDLQTDHPSVTPTWYADNAGAGGTFEGIQRHLDNLMVKDPMQG